VEEVESGAEQFSFVEALGYNEYFVLRANVLDSSEDGEAKEEDEQEEQESGNPDGYFVLQRV